MLPLSASTDANWQALSDVVQQLLAGVQKPFKQGAGQLDAGEVLQQLAQDYARDPARWQQLQQGWYQQQLALWARMAGQQSAEAETPVSDRRFRAQEWREPYFNWLSQSYLITAQWLSHFGVKGEAIEAARPEALVWALERGSRSGRVAYQFARDYAGRREG